MSAPSSPMFSEPPREKRFPTTAVAIASVAIVIILALLIVMSRRKEGATLDASYAANLAVSNVHVSQSDQMTDGRTSMGKITYIEGHVQNNGSATVTKASVKVVFGNDAGAALEAHTVPLKLIRIRQPEVDTVDVADAPIAPGKGADFYLIFENVSGNWNEQPPAVTVVGVETK